MTQVPSMPIYWLATKIITHVFHSHMYIFGRVRMKCMCIFTLPEAVKCVNTAAFKVCSGDNNPHGSRGVTVLTDARAPKQPHINTSFLNSLNKKEPPKNCFKIAWSLCPNKIHRVGYFRNFLRTNSKNFHTWSDSACFFFSLACFL